MSTIKVNKIENTTTSAGGVAIDSSGHVQVDGVQMPTAGALSNRNLIINGAMVFDQRNSGSSVTPSNTNYIVDRFRVDISQASKFTSQQVSDAPDGFEKSLKITSSSAYSVGAGDYFVLLQSIEGYNVSHLNFGSSAASTVTLSFWVKSSLSGTFPASLRNSGVNRSQIKTYTVSSADTWEYKTLTFAGDTSGTWLTNNGVGLQVLWSLGGGSDFENSTDTWISEADFTTSGSVDLVATNGATWQITGVQLEVGEKATPFEHRSYGDELARCQRYHLEIPAETSNYLAQTTNSYTRLSLLFPQTMRAAPTVAATGWNLYSTTHAVTGYYTTQTNATLPAITATAEL